MRSRLASIVLLKLLFFALVNGLRLRGYVLNFFDVSLILGVMLHVYFYFFDVSQGNSMIFMPEKIWGLLDPFDLLLFASKLICLCFVSQLSEAAFRKKPAAQSVRVLDLSRPWV